MQPSVDENESTRRVQNPGNRTVSEDDEDSDDDFSPVSILKSRPTVAELEPPNFSFIEISPGKVRLGKACLGKVRLLS